MKREPTEEEIKESERRKQLEEDRLIASLEEKERLIKTASEAMDANIRSVEHLLHYTELAEWVKDQGLEIPNSFHTKETHPSRQGTPEERRDTKLFLLATAKQHFGDIEVSEQEVAEYLEMQGGKLPKQI